MVSFSILQMPYVGGGGGKFPFMGYWSKRIHRSPMWVAPVALRLQILNFLFFLGFRRLYSLP